MVVAVVVEAGTEVEAEIEAEIEVNLVHIEMTQETLKVQ